MLTSSLIDSKHLLAAASTAGFRESGATGISNNKDGSTTPMVAVRSNGLALDAVVGYLDQEGTPICFVSEEYLSLLNRIAIERFKVNAERIERFRLALLQAYSTRASEQASSFEDAATRRERKRAEGLAKQEAMRAQKTANSEHLDDVGHVRMLLAGPRLLPQPDGAT